jgi:hypothetical protein
VNATDLLQGNPAGSNPQGSDIIVFSAIDNSNGKPYDATYTEFLRGLTQVGNATTQGLYGNNTN